jgi:hypothetical protein
MQLTFGVELYVNGDVLVDGQRIANGDAILPLAKEAFTKPAGRRSH